MGRDVRTAGEVGKQARGPGPGGRGSGWRRLQAISALAVLASFLVPMLISLSFEPFLVAMAAPLVVGLLLLRWPRVGAIWLGAVSLGLLAFSAPFLVDALAHPESVADFIPLALFVVGGVVCVAATVPAFRERAGAAVPSGVPRAVAIAAGSVFVVAAAVSLIAAAGIDTAPARAGDVRLVTEDIVFVPEASTVESGRVSVHVTNRDATRHTFTIDELGVDLNIPPNTSQRISFTADSGTYRFYCRPHAPGMEGVLVVR
jgi:plastocyanin